MLKLKENVIKSYMEGIVAVRYVKRLDLSIKNSKKRILSLANGNLKDKEMLRLEYLKKEQSQLSYSVYPTIDSLNFFLKKEYKISEAIIDCFIKKSFNFSIEDVRVFIIAEGKEMPSSEFYIEFRNIEKDENKKEYLELKNEYYFNLSLKAIEFIGWTIKDEYVCFNKIFN